jgi:hypothetical protein
MMKNFTIAATLIVASFSALADGAAYEYPQPITSNISRAEVRAQTAAAAARGELLGGELLCRTAHWACPVPPGGAR